MENKYYVYIHINPKTNQIFYVGKGKDNRAYYIANRSNRWKNTVNKYGYEIDFIKKNLTNEEALELERYWISKIGRRDLGLGPLINMTDGGDNPPSNKGVNKSPETIQRMINGAKNRIVTNKTRKILSDAHIGNIPNNETKDKMSDSQTKRWVEYRKTLKLKTKEEKAENKRLYQLQYRKNKRLNKTINN